MFGRPLALFVRVCAHVCAHVLVCARMYVHMCLYVRVCLEPSGVARVRVYDPGPALMVKHIEHTQQIHRRTVECLFKGNQLVLDAEDTVSPI